MTDWSWNPPQESAITLRMVPVNGVELELAEMAAKDGSTDRLALCVHGFPELSASCDKSASSVFASEARQSIQWCREWIAASLGRKLQPVLSGWLASQSKGSSQRRFTFIGARSNFSWALPHSLLPLALDKSCAAHFPE